MKPDRKIKPYLLCDDCGVWQSESSPEATSLLSPSLAWSLWEADGGQQRLFSTVPQCWLTFRGVLRPAVHKQECDSSVRSWAGDTDFFKSELQAPYGNPLLFNEPDKSQWLHCSAMDLVVKLEKLKTISSGFSLAWSGVNMNISK